MRLPRIHRSTCIVALGMAVPLAMLNVPGELVSPLGAGGSGAGPMTYTVEYVQGWPWLSLYRAVDYDLQTPGAVRLPDIPIYGVPWLSWTSWEFWRGETWNLRPAALFGDVLASLMLIFVVAFAWEWRRRRRARVFQFTLSESFLAFLVVAAPLGWWWYAKNVTEWENGLVDSIDFVLQDSSQGYHGPLWLRRLMGMELLSPTFMRVDDASLAVNGDEGFLMAVSVLRKFGYLRELRIAKTHDASSISYSELADLKSLRYLTLDHIVLEEEDVAGLAMLRQLSEIDLTDWKRQKPEVMQRLLGALPNCHFSEQAIYYPPNVDGNDRFSH